MVAVAGFVLLARTAPTRFVAAPVAQWIEVAGSRRTNAHNLIVVVAMTRIRQQTGRVDR